MSWICKFCGSEYGDDVYFCPNDGNDDRAPQEGAAGRNLSEASPAWGRADCRICLVGGGCATIPKDTQVTIGRESENSEIRQMLKDCEYAGRRHATLFISGGQAVITDLDSTNHTFVGGMQIGPDPVRAALPVTIGLGRHHQIEVSESE